MSTVGVRAAGVRTVGVRAAGVRTVGVRAAGVRAGRGRDDRGTVTAELAMGMIAVVLVLAAVLLTASASSTRVRCIDAARAGARVAALGAADAEVVAVARRLAPGAEVVADRDPPWVRVVVSRRVAGAWFMAGGVTVTGDATAWSEP